MSQTNKEKIKPEYSKEIIVDRKEKIDLVQKIVDFNIKMNKCDEQFSELFGGNPSWEDGMVGVFSRLFDHHMEVVSKLTGISYESLSWFVFENGCGKGGLAAINNGASHVINSVASFVDFEILIDEQNNTQR